MSTALTVWKRLGLPLHLRKCEGPATVLVVLGIELDSINQAARLSTRQTMGLAGPDQLVAFTEVVQQTQNGVPHWPSTLCCQCGVAWQKLPTLHDRPFVLLPQEG